MWWRQWGSRTFLIIMCQHSVAKNVCTTNATNEVILTKDKCWEPNTYGWARDGFIYIKEESTEGYFQIDPCFDFEYAFTTKESVLSSPMPEVRESYLGSEYSYVWLKMGTLTGVCTRDVENTLKR